MKALIERKIPLGTLCVDVGGDEGLYTDIFIYLRRDDGVEIDLTAVSMGHANDYLTAFIYGDTTKDEYTEEHRFTKEDLSI